MKFDFCIGNPPYQEEKEDSENKTFMPPIYDSFLEAAYRIANKVEMIHPARFLFRAGQTPKEWNEKMLNDKHLKILFYEEDGHKVFPSLSTPLRGGVAISYRDSETEYGAIQVFTKYPELNSIVHKVVTEMGEKDLTTIMENQTKFDLDALYLDHPEYRRIIGSDGRDKRFRNNIFEKIPEFKAVRDSDDAFPVIGVVKNSRVTRYINRAYVDKSSKNLFKWKAIIGAAIGGGIFGESISAPVILKPGECYTQTYIGIGAFDTEIEAQNICVYLKTRFLRCMLGVLKITQHNEIGTWKYIPLQNFTTTSDIDWSKSIKEIDQQLYKKYRFSDEEIDFIETHVKEME